MKDGFKLVPTEEMLDDWLAQSLNVSLNNIPPYKPHHMPKKAYDVLKKYSVKAKNDRDQTSLKKESKRVLKDGINAYRIDP